MRLLAALLLLAPAAAGAQPVVVSPGPASVSVTIYRATDRDRRDIDRADPTGYALITETRSVMLPPGGATIRFEGVAGNIFPETALVAGLPADVAEKNLDADLLSPRTLYDRALGRRVLLRRTDPATGRVTEQQATIRSAADGAAVLQLAGGIETLRCTGLAETIIYSEPPPGLVAKPTLSIRALGGKGGPATVTLSYLAGGFDWQADYVIRRRPGSDRARLFAWITLASADVTGFRNAGMQVVAGKPARARGNPPFGKASSGDLRLKCWPQFGGYLGRSPLPPPPPPAPMMMAADIVVTAQKRAERAEELGDLKLYRLPERTDVAARSQKQVAMLEKDAVTLRPVYVSEVYGGNANGPILVLRGRNRVADGLGIPLPAGHVVVFDDGAARPLLIGEGFLDDKAVGEEVEIRLGDTPGVTVDADPLDGPRHRNALIVRNANPAPIAFEARFPVGTDLGPGTPLIRRGNRMIWATTVPANGTRRLNYPGGK